MELKSVHVSLCTTAGGACMRCTGLILVCKRPDEDLEEVAVALSMAMLDQVTRPW